MKPSPPSRAGAVEGLSSAAAAERLRGHGPNTYASRRRLPAPLVWLGRILVDPMVLLLGAAGTVYLWIGERTDAVAAFVAVIPIALVSVGLELRTERALEELRRLGAPRARTLRDGRWVEIPSEHLVPGDLIEVHEGDVIPADGRVVRGSQLHVDESPLTGESDAVAKSQDSDASLFSGTRVLSGRATATVEATGMGTRYGAIAALLAKARRPATPLQRVVARLFILLTVVAVVICALVVALELLRGTPPSGALIAGISLAMAAIPEEIPVVSTLYLGLGAWRLARDHALVRQLAGVETLGMTTVICTDKTGTLTEGRIRLALVEPTGGSSSNELLAAAVLASEPEPFDPLDRAIVEAARAAGIDVERLHGGELVRDHAFDPHGKYVSHVWRDGRALRTHSTGAAETIVALAMADPDARQVALDRAARLAGDGHRVIAVAAGAAPAEDRGRGSDERELRFLGLIAFADPIRPGVVAALEECRRARIRVILVTGDHPATASAVARACGIAPDGAATRTGEDIDGADDAALREMLRGSSVFARTRPEQKLRLVRALRAAGEVVAVTGDGINDAPALREAHIGVAMGRSGTSVAREAATLVLLDDDFSTIVASVRDGRRIFDNLGRAVSYLIAFHIPLVLVALVIPLVGAPLLLLPLHLVWLEVIVHPTSSLVFEADPPSEDLMRRPPRSAADLLPSRKETALALGRGTLLTGAVLALFLVALPEESYARTLAVTSLVIGQAVLVLTARAGIDPVWHVHWRNPVLIPVIALSVASVALIPLVPTVAGVLRMRPLDGSGWVLASVVGIAAVMAPEILKVVWMRRADGPAS